ncbi:putative ABC-type phosphate/phosphonate transport system, periplasmic component [Vibrio nigripulchritudo SO65]|uniref:phosphate/phosphite/phosphonate ABC transporter substrate-binding protein n=1 Tax=Vibrio nigripulchritudo TaxID=28173 RepID=UPI0003B1AB70|nr:PhnD/SsuA/transferrin family substrate-binding protein [Vibrio nigripulchritudo]CCN37046.1 putative ABC-type phosphate/phosphonate transport system, periplasmic component [Vibrio nigripulchritudo AM115]CCN42104.1 putative ABC-type phosphate/phosphonate transport system, periplasmic component [Vibrio nigripulchritudo FTn2]CCN62649.1 putative ABC-type phosphate/phosphonate transport system, periplasmic component [Vibrio nigripulchritudo POn4]CCN75481.1 putative ABC-type phosphate/phosphonate t
MKITASTLLSSATIACLTIANPVYAELSKQDSIQLNDKPFVVGAVSQKVKSRIKWSLPLANYLADSLKEFGYTHGEVVVVSTLEEMEEKLRNHKVHLLPATVYSALLYEKNADANILTRRWKKGRATYSSIIFSIKSEDSKSFYELNGKSILFEKPSSNSSFFIPAVSLLSQGYELQYLDSHRQKPDSDKVGYMFIDQQLKQSNEINISSWVYQGRADLGAFSDSNWNANEDMPAKIKQSAEVVYESSPYPRDLMLSSPEFSDEMNNAIRHTLMNMHNTAEGKATLVKFQKTTKFDELNEETRKVLDEARLQLPKIEALTK